MIDESITIAVPQQKWQYWQALAERVVELATLAQAHTGYTLARIDEERAQIEAMLADELLTLLETVALESTDESL